MISLAPFGPSHSAETDAAARAYLAEGTVPGFSVAVTHRGRLVYDRGFGTVSPSGTVRPTGKTLFRLGSISKPMTALMVMRLVEMGKVGLDDDVRKHVPSFPGKGATITVRQVLSHTSGIRHYQPGKRDGGDASYALSVAALRVWQDDPLLFPPGERFSYSTHAYTLLGAIVERYTATTYSGAFERLVREPAGVKTPKVEDRMNDRSRRSALFLKRGKAFVAVRPDDLSWKTSGGGMEGTSPDLCRVGDALLAGQIVSLETFLRMGTPSVARTGKTTYGLGLNVGPDYVGHGGAQLGARSFWRIYPRQGVVVTVMSNLEAQPIERLGAEIGKIWTGTP